MKSLQYWCLMNWWQVAYVITKMSFSKQVTEFLTNFCICMWQSIDWHDTDINNSRGFIHLVFLLYSLLWAHFLNKPVCLCLLCMWLTSDTHLASIKSGLSVEHDKAHQYKWLIILFIHLLTSSQPFFLPRANNFFFVPIVNNTYLINLVY